MDKDAILDFIKKNIVSLSCGVVALLCVVAVFYPLGGMLDTLQQDVTAKAAVGSTLTSLLKPGQRKLPLRDLDAADSGPLGGFPTAAAITAGKAANEKWKKDSDLTLAVMVEMNKASHKELVPKLMVPPEKLYMPDYLDFPETYLQILSTDPTVTGIPDKTANPKIDGDPLLVKFNDLNIQNDILHGGMPPQQKDIDDAKNALWEGTYKQQLIEANGVVVNKDEVAGRFFTEFATLPLRLKILAARKYHVYVDADAFNPNPKMIPHQHSDLNDIWYCQLQAWIETDIARAIVAANGSSRNVLEAPVKRLLSIQVANPPSYTMLPVANGGNGAPAAPMPANDSSPILPNFAVSPTGRYCNPLYDVVAWKMVVDVDAGQVNTFLETLSKKTLMTVTCEDEYALNSEVESSKGYLYGKGAVVRLVLTGESLFFREWTKPLMPMVVKQYLGIEAAGPGTTPGGGGGQPGFGGMGGGMGGGGMGGGGMGGGGFRGGGGGGFQGGH